MYVAVAELRIRMEIDRIRPSRKTRSGSDPKKIRDLVLSIIIDMKKLRYFDLNT